MGASLVIWLLLYFILRRLQELVPAVGINNPDVSGVVVELTAYLSSMNFYYVHLFFDASGSDSIFEKRLADRSTRTGRHSVHLH